VAQLRGLLLAFLEIKQLEIKRTTILRNTTQATWVSQYRLSSIDFSATKPCVY